MRVRSSKCLNICIFGFTNQRCNPILPHKHCHRMNINYNKLHQQFFAISKTVDVNSILLEETLRRWVRNRIPAAWIEEMTDMDTIPTNLGTKKCGQKHNTTTCIPLAGSLFTMASFANIDCNA